jgi:hypothetical protein
MDMLEYVEEVCLLFSISSRNLIRVTLICFDDVFLKENKRCILLLKVEKLKEITVKEIAHMPTYFVPGNY